MLKLRRLNLDTSWEINWQDRRIVLDPWLVGSEVDYFKWFNEQWHSREPVHPEAIESPDFILISQSYSDHCHEETLRLFENDIPILASPKAYKRLLKSFPKERLTRLPCLAKEGFLEYKGFKIASIDPGRRMDPVYYAHLIARDKKAIFYSSHGFRLNEIQKECLSEYEVEVMLTSFSEVSLPSFLGGKVNPGLDNVRYLIETLKPNLVLNTHDEEKLNSGFVMKLAKCHYPDLEKLTFPGTRFEHIDDYSFLNIS